MIDKNKIKLNNGNFLCRFCFNSFDNEVELDKCEKTHIKDMKEQIKTFEDSLSVQETSP